MYAFTVAKMVNVSDENIPSIDQVKFDNAKVFTYVDRVEIARVVKDYKRYLNITDESPNVIIFTHPSHIQNLPTMVEKLLPKSFTYEDIKKIKKIFEGNVVYSTNLKYDTLEKIIPDFISHKFNRTLWFGEMRYTWTNR